MQNFILYILIALCIWLLTLSFFFYRYLQFYKKLTKDVQVGDLKKVLEKIITHGDSNTSDIKEITKRINSIEERDKKHVQKVGLVRFNPFSELGGDHSFCLALLDDRDTGVVLTGLHTRERTRIYIKDINNGKSSLELSLEEKKALSIAQKGK